MNAKCYECQIILLNFDWHTTSNIPVRMQCICEDYI